MRFEDAVKIIMSKEIEGGYVNDPHDPGGETKCGISKRAYPDLDIANLTDDAIAAIYYRDYWCKAHCDDISENIRLPMFDCAVNQGVGTAIHLLQRLVRVEQDGRFGPATAARTAILSNRNVAEFLAIRARRYTESSNFGIYGTGWLTRLFVIATANGQAHPYF